MGRTECRIGGEGVFGNPNGMQATSFNHCGSELTVFNSPSINGVTPDAFPAKAGPTYICSPVGPASAGKRPVDAVEM